MTFFHSPLCPLSSLIVTQIVNLPPLFPFSLHPLMLHDADSYPDLPARQPACPPLSVPRTPSSIPSPVLRLPNTYRCMTLSTRPLFASSSDNRLLGLNTNLNDIGAEGSNAAGGGGLLAHVGRLMLQQLPPNRKHGGRQEVLLIHQFIDHACEATESPSCGGETKGGRKQERDQALCEGPKRQINKSQKGKGGVGRGNSVLLCKTRRGRV